MLVFVEQLQPAPVLGERSIWTAIQGTRSLEQFELGGFFEVEAAQDAAASLIERVLKRMHDALLKPQRKLKSAETVPRSIGNFADS
jgi:hypothetical protein